MRIIVFTGLFILSLTAVHAQETEKKSKKELKAEKKAQQIAEVKAIVDGKTFVFNARNANPMRGRTINLTSEYDVKVTKDSIFSYFRNRDDYFKCFKYESTIDFLLWKC